MVIGVAIFPIRTDWKGLYHYLTAVFLESNYEMSSSHHDMDAETNRTSRHSPDLSRSEESSNTALPLKNIAKSGAGANICQVFAIVLLLLLQTLAQKWEISNVNWRRQLWLWKVDYKDWRVRIKTYLKSYCLCDVRIYLFFFLELVSQTLHACIRNGIQEIWRPGQTWSLCAGARQNGASSSPAHWCRVRRQAQNTFTASAELQIFDTVNWKLKPITDNKTATTTFTLTG